MRTEEIIFAVMLGLATLFLFAAAGWGQTRSHAQRALLSFIGLLFSVPVAVVTLMMILHH